MIEFFIKSGGIIFMKKFFHNKKTVNTIHFIMGLVLIAIALFFLYDIRNISFSDIISNTPENPIIAALIVFLLYAIKSVTVFIPLVALQLITGSMFSPFSALIVNFIGIVICYTIPYFIGKKADENYSEGLLKKHPKLEKIIHHQGGGTFFPSAILRCIGFLPTDLVSAYLGTFSTSYFKYITGSLFGSAIRIVAVTILGTSLDTPSSPQFIVSVIIIVLLTVLSAAGYVFYQKKKDM